MRIKINTDGTVQMIYTEDIDVSEIGNVQSITRASHVEPVNGGSQWEADMRPIGGPVIGVFDRRSDALAAEVDWIGENILMAHG